MKFNYRICESCWAITQGLARARISEPPDGGTCELCESRPAVIYKGLTPEEFERYHYELSPGMALDKPLFRLPKMERRDDGPSWGAIILLMFGFVVVFAALALLGHPFW